MTALAGSLSTAIERASQVVAQTRIRPTGELPPSATRLVSMHDPDARPIAKGRLGSRSSSGDVAVVSFAGSRGGASSSAAAAGS